MKTEEETITDIEKIKTEGKTDLQKFIELYKGFGIECLIREESGYKDLIDSPVIIIQLEVEDYCSPDEILTFSDKIHGYGGFHTDIVFDKETEAFISQGIYE